MSTEEVKQSSGLAGAALVVGALSILSRLMGFVRDRILAGQYGASHELDIYFAAFRIPDFFYQMIVVGALSAAFIPLFAKVLKRDGEEGAWRMTSNILNVLMVVFAVMCAGVIIFAKQVAPLVAPGLEAADIARVADLMRVMIAAQFLLAISMIFGSVLQSLRRFLIYSLAPILYNVGLIVGAIYLTKPFGLMGLAYGVLLGAFLHAALQAFAVRGLGYRWSLIFKLRSDEIKYIVTHMPPRAFGLVISQLLILSMTIFASWLGEGSITMLTFAYNLNFFPVGVIGVSYAIAAFPALSHAAQQDDKKDFKDVIINTTKQIIFLLIPITVITFLLRAQVVRAVVGAGEFDWEATKQTAMLLGLFAASFIPQSLIFVLARAYYALDDTMTPLIIGVGILFLQVAVALTLVPLYGLPGLGFSFMIADFTEALMLWFLLRLYIGSMGEKRLLISTGRLLLAGLFTAVGVQLVKNIVGEFITIDTLLGILIQFALCSGVGLTFYALAAWLTGSEEIIGFIGGLKRRVLARVRPAEAIETRTTT